MQKMFLAQNEESKKLNGKGSALTGLKKNAAFLIFQTDEALGISDIQY